MPTRSAAATRSSSAWPRASARRTGCSRRARRRPRPGATSSSGCVETHGRAETAALAEGLEVVPRRRVDYRGTTLEEMDLPAILARAPELALIDELAHTNAPGRRARQALRGHRRGARRRDRRLLDRQRPAPRGLNDQVAELTGDARARDRARPVLADADEIVLVDLTPEALIARLRDGKVYPQERVQAALNNFFRIENLPRCARSRCARWPRRSRPSALVPRPGSSSARARTACFARAAPQAIRRAAARARQARAAVPARRAPRLALVPAARRASSTSSTCGRPGREPSAPRARAARGAAPAGRACSARTSSSRRATTSPRSPRASPRERGTTYVLIGVAARAARAAAGSASRCTTACCGSLPGVDVRIVADRKGDHRT